MIKPFCEVQRAWNFLAFMKTSSAGMMLLILTLQATEIGRRLLVKPFIALEGSSNCISVVVITQRLVNCREFKVIRLALIESTSEEAGFMTKKHSDKGRIRSQAYKDYTFGDLQGGKFRGMVDRGRHRVSDPARLRPFMISVHFLINWPERL